jgi:hypothetical protein
VFKFLFSFGRALLRRWLKDNADALGLPRPAAAIIAAAI